MIKEWVEAYEAENGSAQASPLPKIQVLTETEMKIETYTRRGMNFLENFFRA
jgi:hypothetical protein